MKYLILLLLVLPTVNAIGIKFSTNTIEAISLTPITENKFALIYCDETADDIILRGYYTNGTLAFTTHAIVSDLRLCFGDYQVDVDAFNETTIVTAYHYSKASSPLTVVANVWNVSTSVISDISGDITIDDNANTGYTAQVATLNDSSFAVVWYDATDDDTSVRVANIDGTLLTGIVDADTSSGTSAQGVNIDSWNSTDYGICWFDDASDDVSYMLWNFNGTATINWTGEFDADTGAGHTDSCGFAVLSNTQYTVSWVDKGAATPDAVTLVRNRPNIGFGSTIIDSNIGTSTTIKNTLLNSTNYITSFHDQVTTNFQYSINKFSGAVQGSVLIFNETNLVDFQDMTSQKFRSGIGLCEDNIVGAWAVSHGFPNIRADWLSKHNDNTDWDGVCDCSITCTDNPIITAPRDCDGTNGGNLTFRESGTATIKTNLVNWDEVQITDCEVVGLAEGGLLS